MSGYLIARVTVNDPEAYRQYAVGAQEIVAKFGGRYIVRGGTTETLEGERFEGRIVVIEFPSFERVKAFYNSPEYQEVKRIREPAAVAEFMVADGYLPV